MFKGRLPLDPALRTNPVDRCYRCKKNRFRQARTFLERRGIPYLLDGTNADDLNEYRPGLRANREAGVISPFALMHWTKKDIRGAARKLGLPNWDQPSRACLATRVPYGQPLSGPLLKRIARGRGGVRRSGFPGIPPPGPWVHRPNRGPGKRVPPPDETEKPGVPDTNPDGLGFTYITLDLQGLRSGSMNAVLTKKLLRLNPTPAVLKIPLPPFLRPENPL